AHPLILQYLNKEVTEAIQKGVAAYDYKIVEGCKIISYYDCELLKGARSDACELLLMVAAALVLLCTRRPEVAAFKYHGYCMYLQ
ncbi:hypothetical protein MKW98_028244, partial [Papaver atlanticum]